MVGSLPNAIDNKNVKLGELNTRILKFTNVKDDLIEYTGLCLNKNYQKMFDKNVKRRFVSKFIFCCKKV